MQDLKKVVPPDRIILEDITLAFLPGAKIGVLGANGAGKSSLLKIMGLIDTDFQGEAKPASGIRVGFLPQEPALDESKNVLGNVVVLSTQFSFLLTFHFKCFLIHNLCFFSSLYVFLQFCNFFCKSLILCSS